MVVLVVASMIQGSVGFGANVVAVPLLALLDPQLVPGPVIIATLGPNVAMLWRDRDSVSLGPVGFVLAGRTAGTALGVTTLILLGSSGWISALVAAVVFGAVFVIASGAAVAWTKPNLLSVGLASGFGSGTAGIGGPPLALLLADRSGPEIRGSMGVFFVVGNTMTLIALAIGQQLGREEIGLGLSLFPAGMVGFFTTQWVVPYLDQGRTRQAVLAVSVAAATALLAELLW